VTLPPSQPTAPDGSGPAPQLPRWGLGDVGAGILASMVLSILVGSIILSAAGWESADDFPIWGLGLLQIPLWAGYLGVTWWATSTKGDGMVGDLGLVSRWVDAPVGLVIGVGTQLLVLPLVYFPVFWLTGTDTEELSAPARELAERAESAPSWLLFGFLVGVCAPLVEEIFYRGLVQRSLTKRGMAPWVAVLVGSAVFALVHFQLLQFVGLFIVGLVCGALTARTGRLGPAIWAHIGFNLTTVVALYLNG
jgi:membrane protease YdiL (CAAX protease family)